MENENLLWQCGDIARAVLKFALSEVTQPADNAATNSSKTWGVDFGKRWVGALHDGFRNTYPDTERFCVFSRARPASGPTSTWRRQEFLHDVAVVEAERRAAPVRSKLVPVITRCLWQVESEVGLNSSSVAEDLGKLVSGSAVSKLLIAALPVAAGNLERWIAFIEHAARHVPNNFFLALMPTYSTSASDHKSYLTQQARIRFYTRVEDRLIEDHATISASTA